MTPMLSNLATGCSDKVLLSCEVGPAWIGFVQHVLQILVWIELLGIG